MICSVKPKYGPAQTCTQKDVFKFQAWVRPGQVVE